MKTTIFFFMRREPALMISLLVCFVLNAQEKQEIDWWKSQKIFIGGSLGMGWGEKIDPHMQYSLSVGGLPSTGPYDSQMESFFFQYAASISYYPAKRFSIHLKGNHQSHKLEDITDQDGRMKMNSASAQLKINVLQRIQHLGTVHNIYIGGGLGTYAFNFWKQDGGQKTEVYYKNATAPSIVAGTEYMFMGNAPNKMNILFFLELTADLVTFDFDTGKVNGTSFSNNGLLHSDWKQFNGNAFGIEMGLRFSLFNKKLPMVYK